MVKVEHIHHKRSRSSHSTEAATKKAKITDERVNMDALAFQTPHPNLEAQSVVYQLPSSSPKPSPGLLSPVPPVPIPKKREKSKRAKSTLGPNATSTPVHRGTDITPPSFTLPSGDYQQELRKKYDSLQSASRPSRSSKSTTSSRAGSRERGFRKARLHHRQPTTQSKDVEPLGTLGGDNLGSSTHTDGAKKHSRSSKSKSTQQLLDSPYVSRASSPVRPESVKKAHISTPEAAYKPKQSQMPCPPLALPRSGHFPRSFTDTSYHANLPSNSQHHNKRDRTQAHDKTNHENTANRNKASSKRKSAKGAENQVPLNIADKSSNLERRRSAPTGLTLPRSKRPALQPSRLSSASNNHGENIAHPRTYPNDKVSLKEDVERANGTPNPGIHYHPPMGLRPAASTQELDTQNQGIFLKNTRQSNQQAFPVMPDSYDPHTSWMYARASVDFNRPPSQLDVNIGISQEDDAGDRNWSSSSSSDEDFGLTSEKNRLYHKPSIGFDHTGNFDPDLQPGVIDPFLHSGERTLDRFPPSLPRYDLSLDDDVFAKDIRGFSTPLNLQGEQGFAKNQINHGALGLRMTASFPSLSLHKLSESPPSEDIQQGPHRSASCSDLQDPHRRPGKGLAPSIAYNPSTKGGDEEQDRDPDVEQDMQLTLPADPLCLHLDESRQRIVPSPTAGEDAMSWVTDSIISPPTPFLKWKEQNDKRSSINKRNDKHLDQESQKSATPPDSIITSVSHESLCTNKTATNERSAAVNEDFEQEEPTFVIRGATKRTRSGTIMPASPGTISRSGARRTRSGTIIGPIVASAAATAVESGSRLAGGISSLLSTVVGTGKTRQTRSGTIVASGSANAMPTTVTDSGIGMSISNGGRQQTRSRSSSMLRIVPKAIFQPMSMQINSEQPAEGRDIVANTRIDPEVVATAQEVGGLVDSLYLPPSSPDELDIMFAPCPEEDEEGIHNLDEERRVAGEPASPDVAMKRGKGGNSGSSHTILGLAARAASAGRWLKSKSSRTGTMEGGRTRNRSKVRFDTSVDGSRPENVVELDALGGTARAMESSDDELLLVPGTTASLFR